MKSILTALQDGRLIELPDTDKAKALGYMASIMEAIPEVSSNVDVAGGVLEREGMANTGIGKGWACPHIRVDGDGELFSVLGWSPAGIDYGAPDKEKVHLLVMYYIPENQRNVYLKELSGLAKAIQKGQGIENIQKAAALNDVRNELLNWVSASIDNTMPQAKARMIKLEAKHAEAAGAVYFTAQGLERLVPFYVITGSGSKSLALAQDAELVRAVEAADLGQLGEKQDFEAGNYKIFVRSRTLYKPERAMYDCIAVKR
jgi:mannitol/fructose-specific phosphotransferase system IIA component (Ntr-type)